MQLLDPWRKKTKHRQGQAGQAEIVKFLEQPGSYGHSPSDVKRINTHGAIIFLAGDRAYKLKREVKLSYLDFSTLEKRRAALENELRLNRKTAPELYHKLMPIYRDGVGALRLAPDEDAQDMGEPIEWLLEMQRFDEEGLFDRLADRGALTVEIALQLADAIWAFHEKTPSVSRAPWPQSLRQVGVTIKDALADKEFADLDLAGATGRLDCELVRRDALMTMRRKSGFVRRCHGDLHLKNIVLIEGEPRLFDALEFDEVLGTIDIFYDLAFLLMDLWHRGLRSEANAVLNRYFARYTGRPDWDVLALLPLFMAMRAGVRAMVGLDRVRVAGEAEKIDLRNGMRDYAKLFEALIAPADARFIAIGGMSGTGKTTVARALAADIGAAPGAIHLRSDVERKAMFRAPLTSPLARSCYTETASQMVYERICAKAGQILKSGHSVILDATFTNQDDRDALAAIAGESGVALEALWLRADDRQMIDRVTQREGDASDADAEVVRQQLAESGTATPEGWREVDARGDIEETVGNSKICLNI